MNDFITSKKRHVELCARPANQFKNKYFNDEDIVSEAETKTNPAEGRMQVH